MTLAIIALLFAGWSAGIARAVRQALLTEDWKDLRLSRMNLPGGRELWDPLVSYLNRFRGRVPEFGPRFKWSTTHLVVFTDAQNYLLFYYGTIWPLTLCLFAAALPWYWLLSGVATAWLGNWFANRWVRS